MLTHTRKKNLLRHCPRRLLMHRPPPQHLAAASTPPRQHPDSTLHPPQSPFTASCRAPCTAPCTAPGTPCYTPPCTAPWPDFATARKHHPGQASPPHGLHRRNRKHPAEHVCQTAPPQFGQQPPKQPDSLHIPSTAPCKAPLPDLATAVWTAASQAACTAPCIVPLPNLATKFATEDLTFEK